MVDKLSNKKPMETCGIEKFDKKLPNGTEHQHYIKEVPVKRCAYCEIISYLEESLTTHMITDHLKQYSARTCEICKKSFNNSVDKNKRMIREHGPFHKCHECGKRAKSYAS